MGEYANLTIWRNLQQEDENSLFHQLHEAKKANRVSAFMEEQFPDLDKRMMFGPVFFREMNGNVYYAHIPMDFRKQMKNQRSCKYNIERDWLLPFSYEEMKVKGERFQALTTVKEAVERLQAIQMIEDHRLRQAHSELLDWLMVYANETDCLEIDSCAIYVDFNNDTPMAESENYIKNAINEKVKYVKEHATVPHWKKCQHA